MECSVLSFDRLGHQQGHEGRFSRDPLSVFSTGGPCEQFRHGQEWPLFDVVHPAFPLLTISNPPCKVPWRTVLERLSWHVICQNHESFCPLTVAKGVPVDPQGPGWNGARAKGSTQVDLDGEKNTTRGGWGNITKLGWLDDISTELWISAREALSLTILSLQITRLLKKPHF